MANKTWKAAVSAISRSTSPCDADQRLLGTRLGVEIGNDLPRVVAVARVQAAVAQALGLPAGSRTEGQLDLLEELAGQTSGGAPCPETSPEAQAWVQYYYLRRREQELRELQLNKGDLVRRKGSLSELDEVASIGDDGAVYFKGGRARAWPDELELVARVGDSSRAAESARKTAANRASERSRRSVWSIAKAEALKRYRIAEPPDVSDVEFLRATIEQAREERPIQRLLEARPALFAPLLRGPDRYCLPRVSFGGKYIADFLLADVDSTGIRWILVELETPDSPVTLASKNEFDSHAREGVSQIQEWRGWLERNRSTARELRSEEGLGLVDITPRAEGLVVVGRRGRLRESASALRGRLFSDSRIRMWTYDGFVEKVEGALNFNGPWAGNRDALQREALSDMDDLLP